MTKKDYIFIAYAIGEALNLLKDLLDTEVITEIEYKIRLAGINDIKEKLIESFEKDNGRFDKNKFNTFIENLLKV